MYKLFTYSFIYSGLAYLLCLAFSLSNFNNIYKQFFFIIISFIAQSLNFVTNRENKYWGMYALKSIFFSIFFCIDVVISSFFVDINDHLNSIE